MSQETVSQRLKILIKSLGLNTRSFSQKYGVNESTTRGYIDRGSVPSADYIGALLATIENLNPSWLLLGRGEMFLTPAGTTGTNHINTNAGQAIGVNHGTATYTIADCEKDRDTYKAERDLARAELLSVRQQLELAQALVAAKEEMLSLLRGGYNRPN